MDSPLSIQSLTLVKTEVTSSKADEEETLEYAACKGNVTM